MICNTKEFDDFYRRFAPLVFRRAFSLLGDEEEARDCLQQAFTSLWESYQTVENPEAYVTTLVNHSAAAYYRQLSVQERFARLYPIELKMMGSSDEVLLSMIRRYVEEDLTEAVRRVVKCVFFERLSYKETAERLGLSIATVNKHVVTALRQMREHFKNIHKL